MIVYNSLCIFLQVAVYMNCDVQVFIWTACPCQHRPPLEPRASMYAKRSSPSRNQSNTLQNESLNKEICFGSYFRFGRHESQTSCRESTFQVIFNERHACAAAATRVQYKIMHRNNSNCGRRVTHVHSNYESNTHLQWFYTHLHSCTASTLALM